MTLNDLNNEESFQRGPITPGTVVNTDRKNL